jgi:hypothetical protein
MLLSITHDIFIHLDKALLAPKYSGVSSLEVLRPFYILDPFLQSDAPSPHILDPLPLSDQAIFICI